ncbi:MAG TPA: hypothetical protein VGR07_08485 [Thermoanaerobaculia bacterium]|nr:hypothetical protein [Thermoanaerobaculia bacterium]
MHPVSQPDDERQPLEEPLALLAREGAGVGEAPVLLAELVQVGQVLRRAEGDQLERPPFVGLAVGPDLHPGRGRGQGVEVGLNAVPGGEALAQRVAEKGLGARHPLVERRQLGALPGGEGGEEPRQCRGRRRERGGSWGRGARSRSRCGGGGERGQPGQAGQDGDRQADPTHDRF